MSKVLIINAHPDFKDRSHYSTRLEDYTVEKINADFPDSHITILNLYESEIPAIDSTSYSIYRKQATMQELTDEEKMIFEQSTALLKQFKDHDRIIISSPLHNFNITARLKDYLDNIMVARETFRYTESGIVGMMDDNRKVLYLQSSGSVYTNNDRYTALEFSHMYLKQLFTDIMAFDSYYIARLQGTSLGLDNEELFHQAKEQVNAILPEFFEQI